MKTATNIVGALHLATENILGFEAAVLRNIYSTKQGRILKCSAP